MVRGVTDRGLVEELAMETNGLLAVAFLGCESIPCKHIRPELNAAAKMLKGKVKFVQINANENPNITEEFLVESVPTLILHRDGDEIARYEGLCSREELHYGISALYQKKPEKQ